MEQLCVHALLVQLYAKHLVTDGEIAAATGAKGFGGAARPAAGFDAVRRPVWLGKDYQLQRATGGGPGQRGSWQPLSPLTGPVAAPLAWVEPVVG